MTDVTIVVPTHNRRTLLSRTIDSILRQRGVSIELVVVDDGSTDGTGAWLGRVAARDPRVKVVRHAEPRFVSGARNAGIACAAGRWVAFCDDDDLWAPDKLVAQLSALRDGSARWGCTGIEAVDEHLRIIGHHNVAGGDVLAGLLQTNTIPTGSSVIVERSLLRETGGFDPALRGSEDWELWIRLAQRSPLAAVDRPLVGYRLGGQSLSMDVERMRAGRLIIAERYSVLSAGCGIEPDEARHERYLAKQLLRSGSRWQAASVFAALAFRHGQRRELPRIAGALIAPRLMDRLGQGRASAAVPEAWRSEAEAWLRPIREAEQGEVGGRHAWAEAEGLRA